MSHVRRDPSRQYKEVLKKRQKRKRYLTIFVILMLFLSVFVSVFLVLSPMF